MVKQELLDMLRCPYCMQNDPKEGQGKLSLYQETWLLCDDCGRNYPIIDDIPVLLLGETDKWKGMAKEDLPIPPTKD